MLSSRRAELERRTRIIDKASIVTCGSVDCSGICEASAYTVEGETFVPANATTAANITSVGVVESCKIKIFEGTSAAAGSNEEITHGITNGKKRIAMISVAISCSEDPPSTVPVGAFLTGGGTVQDEITDTRQFQTYYDDDKIYIHTDSGATAMAGRQYVCSIWYTATDIY